MILRDKLQVTRERLEFYYSIAILFIIPLLIVANTLFIVISVRRNFDTELRRKADMANSLVGSAVHPIIDQPDEVQSYITKVAEDQKELTRITVAIPDHEQAGHKVIASTASELQGQTINDLKFSLVASRKRPFAEKIENESSRHWNVVSPIMSGESIIALVATDVSLQQADILISNTLLSSIGILVVTVVIVGLLLLNHFRFVEYALLFRKLKEVDQMKSDFLSVATHELRAPMTVVKGNIENMADGLYGPIEDRVRDALQTMYEETDRLTNLVNDLLNVSRLEQGRINYEMSTVDARDIVEKVTGQFQGKAAEKGLQLTYQKPESPAMITVDAGRLQEIMTNLIDNAIKYSRQGTVVISHPDSKDIVRISVRDTGIGMSAAEREKLFSRFYRIRNEQTQDIGGTGLGLWIIKQYIEHMKGKISVDSMVGTGSEFIIEFPVATQQPETAPKQT